MSKITLSGLIFERTRFRRHLSTFRAEIWPKVVLLSVKIMPNNSLNKSKELRKCSKNQRFFFFLTFFGFGIRRYCRVNYVFCSVFQKFVACSMVAFFKEKKAFVFSYASELFSSRTLWSLFLFLSRLVCRFKKFIAFLSSLETI